MKGISTSQTLMTTIRKRIKRYMNEVLSKEMIENGIRVATDLENAFRKAAEAYKVCERAGLALTAFLLAENLGTYKKQLREVQEEWDVSTPSRANRDDKDGGRCKS